MSDLIPEKRKVFVIGHKRPDTDSICSAIAYAYLKNQVCGGGYAPARTGEINQETAYVMERFHMPLPKVFEDVSAQVQDIDIRQVEGVAETMTMHDALVRMRDEQVSTLPVISEKGHLRGLVTINNLAVSNMDNMSSDTLAKARTPLENILRTLSGTLVTGSLDETVTHGKIVMGSGSPELIETVIAQGDIAICGNRYDSQLCAIEMNAACVIICSGAPVAKTIVRLAEEHGAAIISTPLDPFAAACTINQSVPIAYYMFRRNLVTFNLTDSVEEAREVMGKVRHVYFPVLDAEGRYCGVISRRNFLNLQRKRLILVDHNERSQCVDGYKEAEILEIIDHHRIGSMETAGPVYFRNQPVGCTATIINQMFQENGVAIPPEIAGILCSAILSDTLMFRSPTCTPLDEQTARTLAAQAGVDVEQLAGEMFEAGENLDGKEPEEVFFQDFKRFENGDVVFGVGQGSFVSKKNLKKAKELIAPYLVQALAKERIPMVFFLFTSIRDQSSEVLCAGDGADELIRTAFGAEKKDGGYLLPGVISRKKQFLPPILSAMQED